MYGFLTSKKEWEDINILLKNEINYLSLNPTPLKGVNRERMADFYNKVRLDIPNEFKNSLCPKPDSEVESVVKEVKNKRSQDYKARKQKKNQEG